MRTLLFALLFLPLAAGAITVKELRTEVYAKDKGLKKIQISLELTGQALRENEVLDSVNAVLAGFFYEDLFTQRGKELFKATLANFLAQKYKAKAGQIYILALAGVRDFDIEEFKKFLKEAEPASSRARQSSSAAAGGSANTAAEQNLTLPPLPELNEDENAQKGEDELDYRLFAPKIPKILPEANSTGAGR